MIYVKNLLALNFIGQNLLFQKIIESNQRGESPLRSQQTMNYSSLKLIQSNSAQNIMPQQDRILSHSSSFNIQEQPQSKLNLKLSSHFQERQNSIFADRLDRSPTLSNNSFLIGQDQLRNQRSDSIRKQRTGTGTVKLSMIHNQLRSINHNIMVNQLERKKQKIKISLLNPFSIFNWLIDFFSQYFVLNDINKRIIDSKQKDYFDNQIIYWNLCIVFFLLFIYPLYQNINEVLSQNLSLTDTSNWFVHILQASDSLTPSIVFGYLIYIFLILLVAIFRYKSNDDSSMIHSTSSQSNFKENFQNVFTKYNWRINNLKQYKFFLQQRLTETKEGLEHYEKQTENPIEKIYHKVSLMNRLRKMIIVMVLTSSLCSVIFLYYVIYTYIPSDLVEFNGMVAVTKGFLILLVSDFSSRGLQLFLKTLWKQEFLKDKQEIQILTYVIQYLFQNLSIFIYITLHLLVLSGHEQYFFNIITKDTKSYVCKYEQIGFQIGGLYVASVIYSFVRLIGQLVFMKLNVNYLSESVYKLQQQLLLNCLAFVSFFTFICACFLQIILFVGEKAVLSRKQISTHDSYKKIKNDYIIIYGLNSISVFIYFGIQLTLRTEIPDEFTNQASKVCSPYGVSIGQLFITYFSSNSILNFIFNTLTWMPLLYIIIIILLCYFIIHRDKTSKWNSKMEDKQNELLNIKSIYSEKISNLSRMLLNIESNVLQYRNSVTPNHQNQDDFNQKSSNEYLSQDSVKLSQTDLHKNADNNSFGNEIIANTSSFYIPHKNGIGSGFNNQLNHQNSLFSQNSRNKPDQQHHHLNSPLLTQQKSSHYKTFFKEQITTEEEAADSKAFLQNPQASQIQPNQLISKKTFFA